MRYQGLVRLLIGQRNGEVREHPRGYRQLDYDYDYDNDNDNGREGAVPEIGE